MELLLDYTERFKTVRAAAFARRDALSFVSKVALALAFAAMTGIAAQIRVPLPFTPVPITGSTFAVLAAGVLLGRNFGGFSMASYVALGAAGVPWFNGGGVGLSYLAGPTGGYLLGFIAAAMIIGYVTDKFPAARNFAPMLGLMLAVNFLVIHGLGLAWLGVYLSVIKGAAVSFAGVFALGTAPFIVGDIFKTTAAALMAKTVLPKA
jgi:biotin transport system substrate-specific component